MINIVLCSDENYAAYCAVVIVSALENTQTPEQFHFHLITPQFESQTKEKLETLVMSYGGQITIYEADTTFFSEINIDLGRFGIGALLRLFMDRYLPESCEKVIYLDCDLLILDDLTKLWRCDLKGNAVGAVSDLCSPTAFAKRESPYFNSGVLLIDILKWKSDDVSHRAVSFLRDASHDIKYLDQDALNHLYCHQWTELNLRWNVQPAIYSAHDKGFDYLDTHEVSTVIAKPAIIHFIGSVKPWHAQCTHPLQDIFLYFSTLTDWPMTPSQVREPLDWAGKFARLLKLPKIIRRRKLTQYFAKSPK
ncbi:glycosyltransferase family 8 protein [Vibrio zhugei]|uniref:Glycosyltransferase family 8 protein n=1 Tax=Vibrio zhugei TaxID=2479546 RepID=A0ABV7C8A5_9VIBR|nr:glycosyltransferase family 8 protein [Vibrio zhugei]